MKPYKFYIESLAEEKDFLFFCQKGTLNSPFYATHTHNCYELSIVLDGMGVHTTDEEEYSIDAGDVFVIHKGQAHGFKKIKSAEIVNLMYIPEYIFSMPLDIRKIPGYKALFTLEPIYRKSHAFRSRLKLKKSEMQNVKTLIKKIDTEQEEKKPGWKAAISGHFLELVIYLSRSYSGIKASEYHKSLYRIAEAISFIEENYKELPRLDELAKINSMSTNNFLRVFRSATGFSPLEYAIRLRLENACGLLLKGDIDISGAAYESGFSDSNYFSRQFRKIIGLTPRQFRASKHADKIKSELLQRKS
jgi:AraC-like DNA-binding protein